MNKDIQNYMDTIQDERRDLFLKLQESVLKLFPTASTKISYQMPSYTTPKGWIFLGYWKQGVSLYVGIIPSLLEFKQKYPKIKTGKGSINLKLKDEIPWQEIEDVMIEAMTSRTSSMRS